LDVEPDAAEQQPVQRLQVGVQVEMGRLVLQTFDAQPDAAEPLWVRRALVPVRPLVEEKCPAATATQWCRGAG
jgi:hypothetical protein